MKNTIKKIALLGVIAFSAQFAQANHYGTAGCGLGSMAFKQNKRLDQILGATTNGTFGSQTFGISSGTSNCTEDGTATAKGELPLFIEANQVALANDIARGSGETLASLSKMLNCQDSAAMNSSLQANYGKIFSTENIKSARVTSAIVDTLKNNAGASRCSI